MLKIFVDKQKLKKLCVSTFESALAELFFFHLWFQYVKTLVTSIQYVWNCKQNATKKGIYFFNVFILFLARTRQFRTRELCNYRWRVTFGTHTIERTHLICMHAFISPLSQKEKYVPSNKSWRKPWHTTLLLHQSPCNQQQSARHKTSSAISPQQSS